MKTLNAKRLSLVGLTLMLVACGDDLTDDTYQGEPRFIVSGTIQSMNAVQEEHDTYVGVAWIYDHGEGDRVGYQTAAVSDASFPASFTLALYDEPELDHLMRLENEDGSIGYLGVGFVMAFDDMDGDAEFTGDPDGTVGPDVVRGLGSQHIILFAQNIDALRTWLENDGTSLIINPLELQEGYNLSRTVCADPSETFDTLEIIPNEDVSLESLDAVEANDWYCLNIT